MEYPSLLTLATCYDQNGRVSWVSKERTVSDCTTGGGLTKSAYAQVTSYSPLGGIESMGYGNGVVESSGYNNRMQMKSRGASLGAAVLLSLGLYFCPAQSSACTSNNGNLLSQKIMHPASNGEPVLDATQEYSYDAVNRLAEMKEGGVRESYGYDQWGNRWATRVGLGPSPLTPSSSSAYDGATNQTTAGTYDKSGNLTGYSPFTLAYDAEGRLKSALSVANGNARYEYDGEGRRVRKVAWKVDPTATAVTILVYDAGGNLAAEYGAGEAEPCQTCYMTADHVGSTRLMTDGAGAVVRRYDYLPFGQGMTPGVNGRGEKYTTGSYPQPSDGHTVKFTGKERDAETGLDYFGARYYGGDLGRFTGPDAPLLDQDPSDPQSWNLYAYVRNNPLKFVDLTGNDCIYTNNFASDGTVGVERGSCSQKGGTFVDGTININSLSYDRKTNALGYSYSNDAAGTGGAGTLGLRAAPTGDELRLGALGRAGQLAGPVADPRFIAGFYGASALAGYALYAGGAFAGGELTALNIGEVTAASETSSLTSTAVGSGLRRQIAAHRDKLAEYIKNPDAFDNKGILKNASPELRQRIVEGRIKHLQQEIKAFEKGLEKLLGGK